jgi:hypothetical protein
MPERNPVLECIAAFMRRNYLKCANESTHLLRTAMENGLALDFEAVLLNVISLERLAKRERAFQHAAAFKDRLSDSWQQAIMMLAIRRGRPEELLHAIGEKRDDEAARRMWQLAFCFGAQFVSGHKCGEARKIYHHMLTSSVPPISCMEMVLLVVDYNYICYGSALSEFDKPIVELNIKCSQTPTLQKRSYSPTVSMKKHMES